METVTRHRHWSSSFLGDNECAPEELFPTWPVFLRATECSAGTSGPRDQCKRHICAHRDKGESVSQPT